MADNEVNIPTIGISSAVLCLDPDGGWDHETGGGWPQPPLYGDLAEATRSGYVERSSAYGAECWRLTDKGMMLRKQIRP